MIQAVMACGVIIFHVIALASFKPYKRFQHTLLALIVQTMMVRIGFFEVQPPLICSFSTKLLVFLGGISLKVKVEVSPTSAFGRGISDRIVGACLLFALVSVLFLAVAMMVSDLHDAARSPVMRHVRTHSGGPREPISFPVYAADDHFHLFLSHVWSTGQDQVLAIKKELKLLVPSLRIFLDIEK
jgi:hypothetical protein